MNSIVNNFATNLKSSKYLKFKAESIVDKNKFFNNSNNLKITFQQN